MPIPTLTDEDTYRLTELQARLVRKVFEHWEQFELPLSYGAIAGGLNKLATKQGMTVLTLIDTLVQMGYIQRIATRRGGVIILPDGVWAKLPVYKQESWRNPSKAKTERERELDTGRRIRLLPEERDVPLRDVLGNPIAIPEGVVPPKPKPALPKPAPVGEPALKNTILGILQGQKPAERLSVLQKGPESDPIESDRRRENPDPGGSSGEPDQRSHK